MNYLFRCPCCHMPLDVMGCERCNGCGFIVEKIEGMPILVQDRQAMERHISKAKRFGKGDWYESEHAVQTKGPYRHHLAKRREYLESTLASYTSNKKQLRGIDLGCGDGINLSLLSRHVEELYGSDYNLVRLIRALGHHTADLLFLADVIDYPVQDDSFDLILFNHVLEHIPDDIKALNEVYRILKPGGLLILGVPNEGAFFWQLAYRFQPHVLAASDHVQFYTAESISDKCSRAGFRVHEVHLIGWGIPHWDIDQMIRTYKFIDDLCEWAGRKYLPSQATSLYITATK